MSLFDLFAGGGSSNNRNVSFTDMSDREYYQCRYCGKRTWIRKGSGVYQLPHGGTGCPARGKVNGHAIDHEWRRVGM